MDPFSHLLLGYLLGFGVWGPSGIQYVVTAAVAGALPDADVALFVLSKRFPLLRHRGISHSLVGVTIIAGVGTILVPYALGRAFGPQFANGSPWGYFTAMEIGGLSHILLDAMDHWSVPIFAPFSPQEYHFDADRIVNVGSMSFTVLAYVILLEERGRVSIWVWSLTTWVLLAVAIGYIAVRLLARWRAEIALRRWGFSRAIPQANPLVFLFESDEKVAAGRRLRIGTFHLVRGTISGEESIEVGEAERPVDSLYNALARSYGPAIKASWTLGETLHFAKARAARGGYDVFWYSLEINFVGRAAGVLARVESGGGQVTTRNVWRNPSQPFGESENRTA